MLHPAGDAAGLLFRFTVGEGKEKGKMGNDARKTTVKQNCFLARWLVSTFSVVRTALGSFLSLSPHYALLHLCNSNFACNILHA